MLRLLADENLNADIVRGLLLRRSDIDVVSVRDVGISGVDDSDVLAWAATDARIILTHDRATMPGFAYERVGAGGAMPGVVVIHDRLPIGQCIQELLLLIECSEQADWNGLVVYLPL